MLPYAEAARGNMEKLLELLEKRTQLQAEIAESYDQRPGRLGAERRNL